MLSLDSDVTYVSQITGIWQNSLTTLQWCHHERDGVSDHQPHDCLLSCLFRRRSKKTSKLRVTGLCAGNSPVTDEFPTQKVSNTYNVSIWWRHHENINNVESVYPCRDHFAYAPSQWEKTLLCNVVSHWVASSTERSLSLSWLLHEIVSVGKHSYTINVDVIQQ